MRRRVVVRGSRRRGHRGGGRLVGVLCFGGRRVSLRPKRRSERRQRWKPRRKEMIKTHRLPVKLQAPLLLQHLIHRLGPIKRDEPEPPRPPRLAIVHQRSLDHLCTKTIISMALKLVRILASLALTVPNVPKYSLNSPSSTSGCTPPTNIFSLLPSVCCAGPLPAFFASTSFPSIQCSTLSDSSASLGEVKVRNAKPRERPVGSRMMVQVLIGPQVEKWARRESGERTGRG